jgi:hypothetical protein
MPCHAMPCHAMLRPKQRPAPGRPRPHPPVPWHSHRMSDCIAHSTLPSQSSRCRYLVLTGRCVRRRWHSSALRAHGARLSRCWRQGCTISPRSIGVMRPCSPMRCLRACSRRERSFLALPAGGAVRMRTRMGRPLAKKRTTLPRRTRALPRLTCVRPRRCRAGPLQLDRPPLSTGRLGFVCAGVASRAASDVPAEQRRVRCAGGADQVEHSRSDA